MDIYQILTLCGVGTLSATIVTLAITSLYNYAKNSSKKAREIRRKENQENVRSVVKEEIDPIKKDLGELKESFYILGDGSKASLKNDLITCFYRCRDKGFKTDDDATNFRTMLEAYHKLHGNSFIDEDVIPAFDKLPLKQNSYEAKVTRGRKKKVIDDVKKEEIK